MFYLEMMTKLAELLVHAAELANLVGDWRGPCGPLLSVCTCLATLNN